MVSAKSRMEAPDLCDKGVPLKACLTGWLIATGPGRSANVTSFRGRRRCCVQEGPRPGLQPMIGAERQIHRLKQRLSGADERAKRFNPSC